MALSHLPPETRFCIVGAGAAGLSVAWYLGKRGYHQVTLLEKSHRAGGKCLSIDHQGVTVDLGAALLMPDYDRVRAIAAAMGAKTIPMPVFRGLSLRGGLPFEQTVGQMVLEKHSLIGTLRAGWRYLRAHRQHAAALSIPGFASMAKSASTNGDQDLSLPFRDWAARGGMEPLLTQLLMPFAAFGYGDVGRLPVAYVMRYITPRFYFTMSFRKFLRWAGVDWPRRFERGYGQLWEKVAERFDVRRGVRIGKIERESGHGPGQAVEVKWSEDAGQTRTQQCEAFDVLIVACDPRSTAGVLDWSGEERRLFDQVRTEPYSVTVCETSGLPSSLSFLASPGTGGRLMQFWKPEPGPGPCAFYTSPAPGMSAEDIMACVREDLRVFHPNAEVGRILKHRDWFYFPHVDAQSFADGFFDDFEALQGSRGTWYCGALAAFESIENVVAYAEALVERVIRAGTAGDTGTQETAGQETAAF